MKIYENPVIEIVELQDTDVISCSFDLLEKLPPSGNTPNINLDQNIWEW